MTPGSTGKVGKWSARYSSARLTYFTVTIRWGESSSTLSTRLNFTFAKTPYSTGPRRPSVGRRSIGKLVSVMGGDCKRWGRFREGHHLGTSQCMHNSAIPSVAKNPQQSVTVVAHTLADCAGSKPRHFLMNGIATP